MDRKVAFRGGGTGGSSSVPPKNYVPGLGRGASGFTTRSDVGPALPPTATGGAGADAGGGGDAAGVEGRFGRAPANYVAGAGRGAGKLSDSVEGGGGALMGVYDAFGGYQERSTEQEGQFDHDDDEADQIWAAIDERMQNKKKRKRKRNGDEDDNQDQDDHDPEEEDRAVSSTRAKIGAQFRELKEGLKTVTEDQWASIPDVGDYSLKYKSDRKNKDRDVFTPVTDQLLDQRHQRNTASDLASAAAAAGTASTTVMSGLSAARGTVLGMSLDKMSAASSSSSLGTATTDPTATTAKDESSLLASGRQTTVDPQGYLTQLATTQLNKGPTAEIADIRKARLLLQSVRDTNPKHAPGWIAAARVEEAAGKLMQARKIIQQACHVCPDNEDVWLEAARLHPPQTAGRILASAVQRIPTSVKIFIKAADLERTPQAKRAVLRKGLETNPTSIKLWKAAIALEEDTENAKILLGVAVDTIPHAVEMWLALAKLETYENAQRVLNRARKVLPAERSIWMAAAQLEEAVQHYDTIPAVIKRAVQSLAKHNATVTREQWLQEAEAAEAAGAPATGAALVHATVGLQVDVQDQVRTWSEDAKAALSRGRVATARAILQHALDAHPTKRALWMQAVDLEQRHGHDFKALDAVLQQATERLPHAEFFWLLRAKEQWQTAGNVTAARDILTAAFDTNPNSEAVWLAAAKLEWQSQEIARARVLFQRARERAPSPRVYMKSALLERQEQEYKAALTLLEEGLVNYPSFAKLYMMAIQICSDDLVPADLDQARRFYHRGLAACPDNAVLWILASRLEERAATTATDTPTLSTGHNNNNSNNNNNSKPVAVSTKARSMLEMARLKNPKIPELWWEAVRLERRAGNAKLALSLLAKALRELPKSGLLLAESIRMAPKVERKSKSSTAIQQCPDDPRVLCAVVTNLFVQERKYEKARKWLDRAVTLNPDWGDSWAHYYAFESQMSKQQQQQQTPQATAAAASKQENTVSTATATTTPNNSSNNDTTPARLEHKVKERCVAADPKHGDFWPGLRKDMTQGRAPMDVEESLVWAAQHIRTWEDEALLQIPVPPPKQRLPQASAAPAAPAAPASSSSSTTEAQ